LKISRLSQVLEGRRDVAERAGAITSRQESGKSPMSCERPLAIQGDLEQGRDAKKKSAEEGETFLIRRAADTSKILTIASSEVH